VAAIGRRSPLAASGRVNNIAAIMETPVIEEILTHLSVQARAPPRAPALGQALLHAAGRAQPVTVQAARRYGPREAAARGALCDG
jgi:hypothetical protein